ncbi:MAG: hypothetical protein DHS20C16_03790 [Phycisphaerae bacterium]|nr:MAG: hypothetical protein DHS20C16_03790 [Phycisphaerae bacterium]
MLRVEATFAELQFKITDEVNDVAAVGITPEVDHLAEHFDIGMADPSRRERFTDFVAQWDERLPQRIGSNDRTHNTDNPSTMDEWPRVFFHTAFRC